ncbi:MAG: SurA N-terminal domain-containing protein [Desulfurobacteriaceae bacterium]
MKKLVLATAIIALVSSNSLAGDKVLAKVNGKPITESDLNKALNSLPEKYSSVKGNTEFRKRVLETLINQELLFQEAQKEGIPQNPKVRKQIEEAKKKIIINALLKKHLKFRRNKYL